jgi:hypothetical protein
LLSSQVSFLKIITVFDGTRELLTSRCHGEEAILRKKKVIYLCCCDKYQENNLGERRFIWAHSSEVSVLGQLAPLPKEGRTSWRQEWVT